MKRINNEEMDAIQITQDDKDELEGMAAIGLVDCEADHEEYAKRVPYLLEQRLKSKTAQTQLEACEEGHKAKMRELFDYFKANIAYWEDISAQWDDLDDCPEWRALKEEYLKAEEVKK